MRDHSRDGRIRFLRELPSTVNANHPAIVPVVGAIRRVTTDPLEQLVMVNDVTHLLVDYDDDERVYGRREFHATLDEMIARRRHAGWIYLRDDCDGRAVFAAHLLAALGISWRLEASYWEAHAWVVARVNGVDYDLLKTRTATPETKHLMYRMIGHNFVREGNPPPYFAWRRAWRERTDGDVTVGKSLGALELSSTADHLEERFSVDWTKVRPGGRSSPVDPRVATAVFAGFPYGELLQPARNEEFLAQGAQLPGTHASLAGALNGSTR